MSHTLDLLFAQLHFQHLPPYADFILKNYLKEFTHFQLKNLKELDVPLLKLFSNLPEEQLFQIGLDGNRELFDYLIQNKAKEQIEDSTELFLKNQLPQVKQIDVVAEDITLIIYIRKLSLLHFIKEYTTDATLILAIINEIDLFSLVAETASTNVYMDLLKGRINEHAHLIEKINNTIPGAVYVYDVENGKGIYSNNKLANIIGYTQPELNELGNNALGMLLHPGDQNRTRQNLEEIKSAANGEINTYKYRIKDKNGTYKWLRNYESIFKRNEEGAVVQTIGITLDIDKEQALAEALQKRETQLLEAQEIAQMGSFTWSFTQEPSTVSGQTKKILALATDDPATFLQNIHPADKARVEEEINTAKETGLINTEFRYVVGTVETIIWLKGKVNDTDGKAESMNGTVMNVTERHQMILELKESEKRYQQAEAQTHIGNYSLVLATKEVKWSEELFRIYGLDPATDRIQMHDLERFSHPDDLQLMREATAKAITTLQPFDFNYRIYTKDGALKILHARGEVTTDENNKAEKLIGTIQDVTEKQQLIQKLRQSENLYKHAEALAKMGNWTWNLVDNQVEWTDQLYTIYGLPPQSEEVSMERFISFVHPDDREFVQKSFVPNFTDTLVDRNFRIITDAGEEKVLRSIAQIQKDSNGNIISIIGTEQDITERQNLVEELTYSQSLYKQAQSLANIGSWWWDIATNKITWSDELYRIFDIDPDEGEITIDKYISLLHPDDKEEITEAIAKALHTLQPYEINHRILLKDGSQRIIQSKGEVVQDAGGKALKLVGTAQNITERQNLIEELKRKEALYKQAQGLARLGNWTFNVTTKETNWSEELYNIYELPQNEKITFDIFVSFIHPDDKKELLDYLDDCIRYKHIYDKKHRIVLRNGKIKTLQRRGELQFNAHGEIIELFGTTQDITDQQAIENELKENQIFIQKITDATPSIITSYNVNTGKYVFLSEGLQKLLGYEAAPVLEQGVGFFINIVHPDDLQPLIEKNEKALTEANKDPNNNNVVVEFIYRMRHNNGRYHWFHTYGTIFDRNSKGQVEHILNISLDITEQVEADLKIKEQEHFIEQIADASPTILYLFETANNSISYINKEIFYVLGYTPEEIIDSGPGVTPLLYHPEDYNLLPERTVSNKRFEHQDSMMQYECRLKNKGGEWCWVLVREIIFKRDESGKVMQILGAALDITKRKEMEKTLLQNSFQLEQSNASLEEFAYVASHDLKEPLRKIATFGDRLVNTQLDRLTDEGIIYTKKIIDASQRMQIMITDLLSVSMISGDRSFKPSHLSNILEDVLQVLDHKIEQKGAVIEADHLPEANVISSQFRQLFQNLISNSLKFVADNVPPVIKITHTYKTENDIKEIQIKKAERYHYLQFIDNGIGFEEEYAGKIFTIFQRLHGRSEYEGTGIGLAICKKIVEHHGGVIYATGKLGAGATFTIILPD